MVNNTLYQIFKSGSRTYFYSSLFFPDSVKDDVFALYGFVRRVDNFVDSVPQQRSEFYDFRSKYIEAMDGETTGDVVVDSFVSVAKKRCFERSWIDSFLHSMEMDLYKNSYQNLEDLDEYIYGSAEVVGLMMAKIMGLRPESYPYARLLGKSMQYVNFIRDIAEDLNLGRTYFPQEDFRRYGLRSLDYCEAVSKPEAFNGFIRKQLSYYNLWQQEAEKGFVYIPRRYIIPIKTASEMYKWTAEQIRRDPMIVFCRKVKPSVPMIISHICYHSICP